MAINGRSALESLTMFGLKNDGPLNVGGLGVKKNPVTPEALGVHGVTTADKLVPTPKPMKAKERKVNKPEVLTPDVNNADVNKDRKAYMKAYMAKKRAEQKAKE